MARFLGSLALLATAIAVASCDGHAGLNGVGRTFRLAQLPDLQCVENVLRLQPGVSKVLHRELRRGVEHIPEPPQDRGGAVFHAYRYEYSGITAEFSFVRDEIGEVTFWQGLQCFNCTVPQAHVDRLRPFMDRFEERLELSCGIKGLRAGSHEICHHVDCRGRSLLAQ